MQSTIRHWAYCPETGEILGSSRACGLRRHLAHNIRWGIRHGEPRRYWKFMHCSEEALRARSLC